VAKRKGYRRVRRKSVSHFPPFTSNFLRDITEQLRAGHRPLLRPFKMSLGFEARCLFSLGSSRLTSAGTVLRSIKNKRLYTIRSVIESTAGNSLHATLKCRSICSR
jgi:hypothetical protein